jgi:hypothetical protein
MDEEPPGRLFVPPDTVVHRQPEPLPVQVLPIPPTDWALVVGIAAVNRSGRVREQLLVSALGWRGGDRINT